MDKGTEFFDFRIIVPEPGYLAHVHQLCKQYNVLLICDEIQTVSLLIYLFQNIVLNK